MPGISIHVIDVAHGVPASGMRVELFGLGHERRLLADAAVAASGALPGEYLATTTFAAGHYEAMFHVSDYKSHADRRCPRRRFSTLFNFASASRILCSTIIFR